MIKEYNAQEGKRDVREGTKDIREGRQEKKRAGKKLEKNLNQREVVSSGKGGRK